MCLCGLSQASLFCGKSKGKRKLKQMPPKSASRKVGNGPIVLNESLLATDTEKHATSKSLYGDHKARISSNVSSIHDKVRLNAYKTIMSSLKGKTVLHLGCGLGIVSMMAARALAKLVVAVDTSAIVDAVAVVAKQNKLDNITFLRGSIRELKLPVERFDVIICEWMGAFLTNEVVIDDLIYCRDNLLVEGGLMCPDKSSLHVLGISDYQYQFDSVEYWDNVYGFNMTPMKQLVREEASTCHIPRTCLATNTCMVKTVDIKTLTAEQKVFSTSYSIQATRQSTLHFLTFYVDCTFTNPINPGANFAIGINPGKGNAWTEVSVMLKEAIPVNVGDVVKGNITVTPGEKMTIVEVTAEASNNVATVATTGKYVYSA